MYIKTLKEAKAILRRPRVEVEFSSDVARLSFKISKRVALEILEELWDEEYEDFLGGVDHDQPVSIALYDHSNNRSSLTIWA